MTIVQKNLTVTTSDALCCWDPNSGPLPSKILAARLSSWNDGRRRGLSCSLSFIRRLNVLGQNCVRYWLIMLNFPSYFIIFGPSNKNPSNFSRHFWSVFHRWRLTWDFNSDPFTKITIPWLIMYRSITRHLVTVSCYRTGPAVGEGFISVYRRLHVCGIYN